ncbi:hypothetical protein DFH09DRAFT_1068633 [Mycena vulgaris]|nr:hypothetical protein DFH09DRAFT_1068633 [Mycena vulgaris]
MSGLRMFGILSMPLLSLLSARCHHLPGPPLKFSHDSVGRWATRPLRIGIHPFPEKFLRMLGGEAPQHVLVVTLFLHPLQRIAAVRPAYIVEMAVFTVTRDSRLSRDPRKLARDQLDAAPLRSGTGNTPDCKNIEFLTTPGSLLQRKYHDCRDTGLRVAIHAGQELRTQFEPRHTIRPASGWTGLKPKSEWGQTQLVLLEKGHDAVVRRGAFGPISQLLHRDTAGFLWRHQRAHLETLPQRLASRDKLHSTCVYIGPSKPRVYRGPQRSGLAELPIFLLVSEARRSSAADLYNLK